MEHPNITVLSVSNPTGTTAPSAGADGNLGRLALESHVHDVSAGVYDLSLIVQDILNHGVGSPTFIDLIDTPLTYSGSNSFILEVSGNSVIFTDLRSEINSIYATQGAVTSLFDNLQGQITWLDVRVNSISSNYTPLTTTAAISAYLLSRINSISGGTGSDPYLRSEVVAISSYLYSLIQTTSGSGGDPYLRSEMNSITASLQSQIIALSSAINPISASDVSYTPSTSSYWYNISVPGNLQTSTDNLAQNLFFTRHNTLGQMSTALGAGGDLYAWYGTGSTVFNISAGHGYILDHTVLDSSGLNPTLKTVFWGNFTGVPTPYISAGKSSTFVLIDSNGNYRLCDCDPSPQEIRDYIYLGKVSHRFGYINNVRSYKRTGAELYANLSDLNYAVGSLNLNGNIYSPASTNLTIKKSSGQSYRFAANSFVEPKDPHITDDAAINPVTFRPCYTSSVSGNIIYETATNNINPNYWDNKSGVLQTVGNKNWTVQRIYFFPVTNSTYVFYGQGEYANFASAKDAISSEDFIIDNDSFSGSTFRGWLIIQEGTTDLTNTSNAHFIAVGKFGSSMGGGGGSNVTVFSDDLMKIYNKNNPDKTLTFDLNYIQNGYDVRLIGNSGQNQDIQLILPSISGQFALVSDVTLSAQQLLSYTQYISGQLISYSNSTSANALLQANTFTRQVSASLASVDNNLQVQITTVSGDFNNMLEKTGEPQGFENRTDSSMMFDSSTRTFSISGNYYIWVKGKRQLKTGHNYVIPNTIGNHYFYYDSNGSFTYSTTVWNVLIDVPISFIRWDGTIGIIFEERHGIIMDRVTHEYLHITRGTQYESGLNISYTSNIDSVVGVQYSIGPGVIADEDIKSLIFGISGSYTTYSKNGSGGSYVISGGNTLPFYSDGTNIEYNQFTGSTWQLTPLTSNPEYVNYYVIATPAMSSQYQIISIPGQSTYSSLAAAQAETIANVILSGLFLSEFSLIYKITYERKNAYNASNGHAVIAAVERIINSNVSINNVTSSSSHNSLAGLQGGTIGEYYHLTATQYNDFIGRTEVSSISSNLYSLTQYTSGQLIAYTNAASANALLQANNNATQYVKKSGDTMSGSLIVSGSYIQQFGSSTNKIFLTTTSDTTSTNIGLKDSRLIFNMDSYTGNAGGEIVWSAYDNTSDSTHAFKWAAITGLIKARTGSGASGEVWIANKALHTDTSLIKRLGVDVNGNVLVGDIAAFTTGLSVNGRVAISTTTAPSYANKAALSIGGTISNNGLGAYAFGMTMNTSIDSVSGGNAVYGAWWNPTLKAPLGGTAYMFDLVPSFDVTTTSLNIARVLNVNPIKTGAGLIDKLYGIYVENITVGSTDNYAIYTNSGGVRFGDSVMVNTTIKKGKMNINWGINGLIQLGDESSTNIGIQLSTVHPINNVNLQTFQLNTQTPYGTLTLQPSAGSVLIGTTTDHGRLSVLGGSTPTIVSANEVVLSNGYINAGTATVLPVSGAIYIGDPLIDGTWKFTVIGGNLCVQKKVSGIYLTYHEFS